MDVSVVGGGIYSELRQRFLSVFRGLFVFKVFYDTLMMF